MIEIKDMGNPDEYYARYLMIGPTDEDGDVDAEVLVWVPDEGPTKYQQALAEMIRDYMRATRTEPPAKITTGKDAPDDA